MSIYSTNDRYVVVVEDQETTSVSGIIITNHSATLIGTVQPIFSWPSEHLVVLSGETIMSSPKPIKIIFHRDMAHEFHIKGKPYWSIKKENVLGVIQDE